MKWEVGGHGEEEGRDSADKVCGSCPCFGEAKDEDQGLMPWQIFMM